MKADARKVHPPQAGDTDRMVLARLSALKQMSVKELKDEWETLFGEAAPNNSRIFLEIRLGYRIQELTYGGPDRETRRMLDLLADEVEGLSTRKSQIADPRNPVAGTRLVREWDGVAHTVTVLKDGFDWQGDRHLKRPLADTVTAGRLDAASAAAAGAGAVCA